MAKMYPEEFPEQQESKVAQSGERLIYDALARDLGDEYEVIYSVAWLGRDPAGEAKDGEADFVIIHRKRGVVVLEVKGGGISRNPKSGKWTSTDRNNRRWSIKNPADQAKRSKYALRSKLWSLPDWNRRQLRYGHAVAFPHCEEESFDLGPDIPKEIVIYSNHLENISRRIQGLFDYWTANESLNGPGMDGAAADRIVEYLAPKLELKRTIGARIREDAQEVLRLTDQQFALLESLNENRRMAISGGAGTGKTMLALEKARRLANEGFRTLLTCFNRPLAEELREIVGEEENLTVDTFLSYCQSMASSAGIELPSSEVDPAAFFSELPGALERALEAMPQERFDAIIVDEGQDFHSDWLTRLELSMRKPETDILYIFYDGNQKIYGREFALPENMSRFRLTKNLRNTQNIHRFALPYYQGREYDAVGPPGASVELVEAAQDDLREQLRMAIHRLTKKEKVKLEDIAVLTGRALDRSVVAEWDRVGTFKLGKMRVDDPHKEVLVDSLWRFKGLERPVIILIDFADAIERDETLFYIAATRARDHLVVIEDSATIAALGQRESAGEIL